MSISHNKHNTKLYQILASMKHRTTNKNHKQFKDWGGRGITVCDEWKNDFMAFYNWAMANGYKDGLTIDRKNPDGNYEPDNCRWVSRTVQNRNTRLIKCTNKSGYRGVYKTKHKKQWGAAICVDRKKIFLGLHHCRLAAAYVYDEYIYNNNLEHTTNF